MPVSPELPGKGKRKISIIIISAILLLLAILLIVIVAGKKLTIPQIMVPTPTLIPTISSRPPSPTVIIPTSNNPFMELTLQKGKAIPIPGSDITIEYIGASIPNSKCFDCIETTDIALTKKTIKKTLHFSCGGIAGKCEATLTGFDYEITLENTSETTALVKVRKQ